MFIYPANQIFQVQTALPMIAASEESLILIHEFSFSCSSYFLPHPNAGVLSSCEDAWLLAEASPPQIDSQAFTKILLSEYPTSLSKLKTSIHYALW